jgi:hypothetical protein
MPDPNLWPWIDAAEKWGRDSELATLIGAICRESAHLSVFDERNFNVPDIHSLLNKLLRTEVDKRIAEAKFREFLRGLMVSFPEKYIPILADIPWLILTLAWSDQPDGTPKPQAAE